MGLQGPLLGSIVSTIRGSIVCTFGSALLFSVDGEQ